MVSRPPSVDALASALDDGTLPRALLVEVARRSIESSRATGADPAEVAETEAARLAALRPRRVINATGVLLHTNLGRARLESSAAEAARAAAADATPLEYDLREHRRGGRGAYAESLVASLTGAEAALIVNNNAGALLLALATLASDREVIVSRGELIEIGGSFRLPELMEASGARLREVGTTNRTRVRDYRKAIDPATAALLKVHTSNYRVEGFTEEASYAELAGLGAEHGLTVIADVGSGLLDSRVPWLAGPPPGWLASEPAVRDVLADGADIVLFSGDKLLGGPQAGIAVGSRDVVGQMRRHPIARAVRIAGPMLDALTTTLELYGSGRGTEIPFWAMASLPGDQLEARSRAVIEGAGVEAQVIADRSLPGAGTVPGEGIPGPVILIPGSGQGAWESLITEPTPIVARRDDRGLIVDLRAVDPTDDKVVAAALATACR